MKNIITLLSFFFVFSSCLKVGEKTQSTIYTQYFTPDLYSNLVYWLDSESLSHYQNGEYIQSWMDKSASKKNMIQPTSAFAPTARPNALNGFTSAYFNGSKYMSVAAFSPAEGSRPRTFFVLLNNSAHVAGNYQQIVYSYGTGSSGPSALGIDYNLSLGLSNSINIGFEFNQRNSNSNMPLTAAPIIVTSTYDGTKHSIYINGVVYGTNTVALNTATSFPFTLGKNFQTAYNVYWGKFELLELIMYDRLLNATEIENIHYYLNQKYKIN